MINLTYEELRLLVSLLEDSQDVMAKVITDKLKKELK